MRKNSDTKSKDVDSILFTAISKISSELISIEDNSSKNILTLNATCRCQCGHVWSRQIRNFLKGGKCPKCRPNCRISDKCVSKYTLDSAIIAANKNGGFCLSSEIKSVNTIVDWRCKEGHEWKSRLSEVVNADKWCRECATTNRSNTSELRKKSPYLAEMIQELSRNHRGRCITLQDIPGKTIIRTHHCGKFECENGHQWETRYNVVLRGGWCARCVYNKRQLKNTKM